MKKLLIPIILVVLIGAGVAVYFLMFAGGEKEEPAPVLAAYNAGDSYVTNVKWDNPRDRNISKKLIRAGVYLMVDERMMVDLGEKTSPTIPLIRDTILFIFRDLTEEDVLAENATETIKQLIVDTLNERLELNEPDEKGNAKPKVHGVLFTDFVMQ